MPSRPKLMQSILRTTKELSDEDLDELQCFADYLINSHPSGDARLTIHELPSQHKQTSVLITYILQAEASSPSDKLEAQEAIKKASWIQ